MGAFTSLPQQFWWYMAVSGLFLIVKWSVIIIVIALVVKKLIERQRFVSGIKTPLEIAKERYAKGEMAREEFERLKKDIL